TSLFESFRICSLPMITPELKSPTVQKTTNIKNIFALFIVYSFAQRCGRSPNGFYVRCIFMDSAQFSSLTEHQKQTPSIEANNTPCIRKYELENIHVWTGRFLSKLNKPCSNKNNCDKCRDNDAIAQ